MKVFFTSYIWLMPFVFCVAGYMGARLYMNPSTMRMPSLIGMDSTQTLAALSDYQLTPHIVAQKEEHNIPHGTVLQQTPAPGQAIKKRQSVFLVISTIGAPPKMPDYRKQSLATIQHHCKENNSTLNIHHIPHTWPQGMCFAQWPSAQEPLTHDTPLIYVSSGSNQSVIWPYFIGCDAQDVILFLKKYGIDPEIICHYSRANMQSYAGYTITDQRPLAGSCICIDKPEQVIAQLRIG